MCPLDRAFAFAGLGRSVGGEAVYRSPTWREGAFCLRLAPRFVSGCSASYASLRRAVDSAFFDGVRFGARRDDRGTGANLLLDGRLARSVNPVILAQASCKAPLDIAT